MKSIPIGLSLDDVTQWLDGGWFLFRKDPSDVLEPAALRMDHDHECYRIVTLSGKEHALEREQLFPFWPVCGALNIGESFAISLVRYQVRQYRRTYNEHCLDLIIPRKWDAMKVYGKHSTNITPNTVEVITAAFNPIYYTYSTAIRMIADNTRTSVAITPHLIIAGVDNDFLVYYRTNLIARIHDGLITPLSVPRAHIQRLLKFFDGRVNL